LDRFFFKLLVEFSDRAEIAEIIDRTTRVAMATPAKVLDGETILGGQQLVREVILAAHVRDYIVRLVLATHPDDRTPRRSPGDSFAGARALARRKPSPWLPRPGRYWMAGTMSASRTCGGFSCRPCVTA